MIIYGTGIICDISFPLEFPEQAQARSTLSLVSGAPEAIRSSITCGIPLYRAHGRSVYLYSDDIPLDSNKKGQPWCYEIKDILRFYWQGGEQTIFYEFDASGTPHLLCFWFVHLFLPLYLSLENMYDFFHAGAVEIDNKPVLFIAPTMGGKSTLVKYFLQTGHTLVSDDKVAVFMEDGRIMAVGSHPYYRPYRKHEDLGIGASGLMEVFRPIHSFYVLEQVPANSEVLITETSGFEKFASLLPNYLYMFSFLKPQKMRSLSSMVNATRVFRIRVPGNLKRLPEVHDAILAHCKTLQ
jgi:hypothetical protein